MPAGTYHATAAGRKPSSPSSCARPSRSACVTAHVDGGSPSRSGPCCGALGLRARSMTQRSELLPSGRGIPARCPARGYATSCRGLDAVSGHPSAAWLGCRHPACFARDASGATLLLLGGARRLSDVAAALLTRAAGLRTAMATWDQGFLGSNSQSAGANI